MSIIATYKGKILLFSKDSILCDINKNIWSFMGEGKIRDLKLKGIKINRLSSILHHVKLTDEDVNNINRAEGNRLEFYGFGELGRLSLTEDARLLIAKYRNEIKELLAG